MTEPEQKKRASSEAEIFSRIDGLKPVDPAALEPFARTMTEKVIPEIVKMVEQRRELAAKSRRRVLKY
jgi:hypothetical protein